MIGIPGQLVGASQQTLLFYMPEKIDDGALLHLHGLLLEHREAVDHGLVQRRRCTVLSNGLERREHLNGNNAIRLVLHVGRRGKWV